MGGRSVSAQGYDAFVSAVSSECGRARDTVAAELRKQGLRVAVQSDLRHGPAGVSLLRTLHDTIRACREVHCLVGQRSGACPAAEEAAPFGAFLPVGVAEASYTQWEYFFARHYLPERTWLYVATEAYPPDAAPTGPDRPELQARFRERVQAHGDDHVRFATVGDVRAEVLARLPGSRQDDPPAGDDHHGHEPLHRGIAANAIGSLIAGVLLLLLSSVLAQWAGGSALRLLLLVPAMVIGGLGAVGFFVLYRRYEEILRRRGADARAAYDGLRQGLAEGGLAARIYAYRLDRALDAVDRFFGDAGQVDRTLFPRAFGLRTPAPLWTAASFDRCLLLALVYPVATIFMCWAFSGHVGPAEHALMLSPNVPALRRAGCIVLIVMAGYGFWQGAHSRGLKRWSWTLIAVTVAIAGVGRGSGAFEVASVVSGFGSVSVAVSRFGVGTIAGAVAGPYAGLVVSGAARAFADTPSGHDADAFLVTFSIASSVPVAIAVALAIERLNAEARGAQRQNAFLGTLVAGLGFACLAGAFTSSGSLGWTYVGPLSLFLGLLTLINAPFDWVALGLTRALLRRGLELGGWFPYALAVVDAVAAAAVIAMLTIVSVLGVQAFDGLAAHAGGSDARILPLRQLFDGMTTTPTAPEYWWVYFMLFSTMIPSLLNLMIGGASLLRGVPWLTRALLHAMPEHRAPASFNRSIIALVLTSQIFLGGLLGIAAQGFLVYAVIGLVLPWFGLDLLALARTVAAPDLPGQVIAWLLGPPVGGGG